MDLLCALQQIPCPSGDEGAIADFLEASCRELAGVEVRRVGDVLLCRRGEPQVAILSHLDTVGFTLGSRRRLFRIGGARVEGGERLREVCGPGRGRVRLRAGGERPEAILSGKDGEPGTRWVFSDPLKFKNDKVIGPYLDNRAGVWNAFRCLETLDSVAVAFTTCEEHGGGGALVAGAVLYEQWGISQALISDITWHTRDVRCGRGPAVSLRDASVPRRRFVERVLALAEQSGLPFQREVESEGGSDGSVLARSPFPIDWVFIGAPQKRSHTPREECRMSDLHGMLALYRYLAPALSQ